MSETPPSEPPNAPEEKPAEKRGLPNVVVRFLSAGVGIPILLWMLYLAPPVVFAVTCAIAAGIGGSELAGMTLKGQRPLQTWMVVSTALYAAAFTFLQDAELVLAASVAVVVLGALSILIRPDPMPSAAMRMGWLIAGPFYIGGCAGALARLHQLENGGSWVVLSMALAWMSDTGGYFAGKAFGKHKLYEKISPKKTVEGSIGGLVAIVAFALVMRFTLMPELGTMHTVVLALVAGAIGQAGDLCISVIKRSTGVKDSGFIIPGHGGLLDRVDALLFTASVTWMYGRLVLETTTHAVSLPF
ncbi:MAG: phosphatidate cytidylyltransferase [Sandaracinaceae bacterium]